MLLVLLFAGGVALLAPSGTERAAGHASGRFPDLEGLGVGVDVATFRQSLGRPEVTGEVVPGAPWTETVWVTPHWAVQTVSGADGTVALYSVTTRDAAWHPTLRALEEPGAGPLREGLGTQSFAEYGFGARPGAVSAFRGDGPVYWYSESHPGRAGGTVVLTASETGFNRAGPERIPGSPIRCSTGPLCEVGQVRFARLAGVRHALAVTTVTVLDEHRLPVRQLPSSFRFGPDLDATSLVDPVP